MKKFNTLISMYHYLTDGGPSRYLFGGNPWQDEWKDALIGLKEAMDESPMIVGATFESLIDIPDYGELETLVEINRINGVWELTERVKK